MRIIYLAFLIILSANICAQEIFDMPGATNTYLTGINDSGEICGYYTDNSGNTHGFEINKYGDTINIAAPGNYTYCSATGINNNGLVVGNYGSASNPAALQGFVFYPAFGRNMGGTYTTVTTGFGGTYINCKGIANDSCISGSQQNGPNEEGTLWCNGYSLPTILRCTYFSSVYPTYGCCINSAGNVGGYIIQGSIEQAMIYRGSFLGYDTFMVGGFSKSRVLGMNDNGWICGNYNAELKGFLCKKLAGQHYSNFSQINVFGAVTIYPSAINNQNDVVGYYLDDNGVAHGFIYAIYDNGFRPSVHGYRVKNGNAFPSSYYDTISYVKDPYWHDSTNFPQQNNNEGPPFSNFWYPTWPDFVRSMQGTRYYSLINGRHIIWQRPFLRWIEKKDNFDGACLGMAVTSLVAYDSVSWYTNRWPSGGQIYAPDLFHNPDTASILAPIHQAWCAQFAREMKDFQNLHHIDLVHSVLQKLKQNLRNSQGRPHAVLVIESQHHSDLHALVPFRITYVPGQIGQDTVFVYDCNFPGRDTLYITADEYVGTFGNWHYTGNGNYHFNGEVDDWGNVATGQGMWLELPDTSFLSKSLHLRALPYQQPAIARSTSGFTSASFNDSSIVTITDDNNQTAYFSADSSSGTPLVYTDGLFTGVDTIEVTGALSTSNVASVIKVNKLHLNNNFLSIADDDYAIHCNRMSGSGDTDTYRFSSGSLSYINNTSADRGVAYSVNMEDSVSEYNYFISALNVPANNKVTVTTYGNNGMVIQNFGPPTTYVLSTEFITDSLVIYSGSIHIGSNTQHIIQPHDTTQSGIYILVDTGMQGHYEDTIFINQLPTGINQINAPKIAVWPVPAGNTLTVQGPQGITDYTVTDALGRSVISGRVDFGGGISQTINVAKIGPGVYILKGNSSSQSWTYPFVHE